MENLVTFWRNKKVFLTGHTGFKGSWLALWLQALGAEVIGFALSPPTKINLFTEADVAKGMIDIRGDIRDYALLYDAINTHQPDIIIHMAAQPLVRYSYSYPIETYATNVMGTVHVLEAARHLKSVRAVINVTTDKCYDNRELDYSYTESDPMGGYDPYSNSKGCSELVTTAYRNSYLQEQKKGLASARAGNVIGGGDWAEDRLIPDLISACLSGSILKIRYPNAIRPWQHVLEPLSGYLRLAELLYHSPHQYAEAWNFGPDDRDAKSVAWVADAVLQQWQGNACWEQENVPQVHEAGYLKLNSTKAHEKLNWRPRWDIHQALKATVEWYKAHAERKSARELVLKQIKEFTTSTNHSSMLV